MGKEILRQTNNVVITQIEEPSEEILYTIQNEEYYENVNKENIEVKNIPLGRFNFTIKIEKS